MSENINTRQFQIAERDCKSCIHKVPVWNEKKERWDAECDSWNCNYVSREKALQAWAEKQTKT